MKDYHVYYELPTSFADYVEANDLTSFYPELFCFDDGVSDQLALLNSLSSYKILKSKFYESEYRELIDECLPFVLDALATLCKRHTLTLSELFALGIKTSVSWFPFSCALFFNRLDQPDRRVELPGGEVYRCQDKHWTTNTIIYSSRRQELFGYLLKKMEVCVRQIVNYKFKLTLNPKPLASELRRLGIDIKEFDATIEQAVKDYYTEKTKTVVIVDHTNLARIRREARGTQDRLVVNDEGSGFGLVEQMAEAEAAERMAEVEASEWMAEVEASGQTEEVSEQVAEANDVWDTFAASLDATEQQALVLALESSINAREADTDTAGSLKAFADTHGLMLEVLVDNINSKALDLIGDNILELNDGVTVYDEYRQQLEEACV